jgi:hypothetical protein
MHKKKKKKKTLRNTVKAVLKRKFILSYTFQKMGKLQGVVVYTYNTSTQEAEAGGLLAPGQSGPHSKKKTPSL